LKITEEQVMTAEKSVLSAAMSDQLAAKYVAERLAEADFLVPSNREIFRAVRALYDAKKPVDAMLVYDEVAGNTAVERVDGGALSYITDIAMFIASPSLVEHYIELVKGNAAEERQRVALARIMESKDDAILPLLERLVADERAMYTPGAENSTDAAISAYLDELADPVNNDLFTTGIPSFDTDLGGLPRGSLSIIAARPRVGKTALALNITAHNRRTGYNVAFFSLEMTAKQLFDRLAAANTDALYHNIFHRRLKPEQQAEISTQLVELSRGKLNIYDNIRSISGIVAETVRIAPDIIFIDYVQRIRPDKNRDSRHLEIDGIVDRLKELAITQNCHVCLLSQISRAGAEKPTLETLKESGSLEEGGDIIMLLHRDSNDKGRTLEKSGGLIIAKHKYGECGYVPLWFDGAHQRFTETEAKGAR
jgi:replicative DNA helicase